MTDITKCQNAECILAPKCYRRTAKSHPLYQSYSLFHVDWQTGQCEYYLPALKVVPKREKKNADNG